METLKTIVLVLDLISAVLLTATILIQSGKSAGLSGAIAGASDSFMAKGGSKTLDAKLAKATKCGRPPGHCAARRRRPWTP